MNEVMIREIVDFGELPVFEGAATFPIILLTTRKKSASQKFVYAQITGLTFDALDGEIKREGTHLDDRSLHPDGWSLMQASEVDLLQKLKGIGIPLSAVTKGKIFRGILTGLNEAFVIDGAKKKKLLAANKNNGALIKPFVIGDDVRKFRIRDSGTHLILIPSGWTRKQAAGSSDAWKWFKSNFNAVAKHLEVHEKKARQRQDKGEFWWELRSCDYYDEFDRKKIVWPEIAKESRFTIDRNGFYLNKTCFFTPMDDTFLLGLLNSKLVWFFLKSTCSVLGDADKGGRLLQQKIYVDQIPIRIVDFTKPEEKKIHEGTIELVERMLDLNGQLQKATFDSEKEPIQRQIAVTDKKIDKLVYELYGLTEEEIKIVEGEK